MIGWVLVALSCSLVAAGCADWRRAWLGQLGAAYWAHAFFSWLLIPAATQIQITTSGQGSDLLALGQLFAIGVAAHARWRTSLFSPSILFWVVVGGPPMVLCKLMLEVGDPTQQIGRERATTQAAARLAQTGLYFGAAAMSPIIIWMAVEKLVRDMQWLEAWGFAAKTLCWSLLLLSVLELNLLFNLRFVWWLSKQRQPLKIALSTLAHAAAHIAVGVATIFLSIYSLPVAWSIHLTWLSEE
jgi:hypothetical protein